MNTNLLSKFAHTLLILSTHCLTINTAYSQTINKVDSLTHLIEQSENDSIKLYYTNKVIDHLYMADLTQAYPFILNAIQLTSRIRPKDELAMSYAYAGLYHQKMSQYDSAIHYYDRALFIYKTLSDDSSIGYMYNRLGSVYHSETDYVNALKMRLLSLEYSQKIKDNRRIATALYNIGLAEFEMGNYKRANDRYFASLSITNESDYHIIKAHAIKGVGMVHLALKETSKALGYFRQMENLLLAADETILLDVAYEYISKTYLLTKEYDSALLNSNKAFNIAESNGGLKNMAIHQNNTGEIYLEIKDYDNAFRYFNKALTKFSGLKAMSYIAISNFNLAKTHMAQDRYSQAIPLLKESIKNASISRSKVVVKNSYELLSKAYAKTDQFDKAYLYRSFQILLADSIINEVKFKQIRELQTRYETKEKDIEISLKQAALNRSYIIILLLITITITGTGAVFLWKKNSQNKLQASILLHEKTEEVSKHKIAQLIKDKEIEMIIAGLNGQENERKRIAKDLHDGVGGTLSAAKIELQKLNLKNNEYAISISNRIDHACEEIRTISHHLTPPAIKSNSFISLIEQYLTDIEGMYQLDISIKCYPKQEINAFSDDFKTEIYRIIQELTTNVIKHAHAKKLGIQLIKHEDYFNIMIEDDGIGFRNINTIKGIGLKNLSARLKALNGNFDIDSSIGKGTTINIDIQLEHVFETT